jgi:regulatory protein
MSPLGRRRPPAKHEAGRTPPDPVTCGLQLLARRELSTSQIRAALLRRGCDAAEVERAIERLTASGALDDRRTAHAYARTATLKTRGRQRIVRELEALGVTRDLAREALADTLDEAGEDALLEQAIARRVKGPIRDARELRRHYAWLVRLGFPADRVRARLRSVGMAGGADPEDPDA